MKLGRRKELNYLVMFLWIIFYLKESENVSFNEISMCHKESFNPNLYKVISIESNRFILYVRRYCHLYEENSLNDSF